MKIIHNPCPHESSHVKFDRLHQLSRYRNRYAFAGHPVPYIHARVLRRCSPQNALHRHHRATRLSYRGRPSRLLSASLPAALTPVVNYINLALMARIKKSSTARNEVSRSRRRDGGFVSVLYARGVGKDRHGGDGDGRERRRESAPEQRER